MALKLAFNTVACPQWTLEEAADAAVAMGYQGLELRTLGAGSTGLRGDPIFSHPQTIRRLLGGCGLQAVCLSTSISLHDPSAGAMRENRVAAIRALDLAAALECRAVRVFAGSTPAGYSRANLLQLIADQAQELAAHAEQLGVDLLLENAGQLHKAHDWWRVLAMLNRPSVGMLWNVGLATMAGESPAISVPGLNSRIRLVRVLDWTVNASNARTLAPLGQGKAEIEHLIKRLMGIGYTGFVSVEWDRLAQPALPDGEAYLRDAHQRLTAMLATIVQTQSGKSKAKPAAAKPAASTVTAAKTPAVQEALPAN